MKRVVLRLCLLACSKTSSKEEPTPAPSALAAAGSAAASAAPKPAVTTAGTQLDGVVCRAAGDGSRANAHFRFETMKGTVLVDGVATRRILTKATASGGTYVLQFLSYEAGDAKPAAEKLVPNKSIVARVVADGDHDVLHFDGDVHPPGLTGAEGYPCEK